MDLDKKTPSKTRTFDPANPDYKYRLWIRRRTKEGKLLYIFWKRVAAFMAVMAVVGWFALALAAMLFVEARHRISDVRYVDIAFPWRWNSYHRTIGKHLLLDARTLLENGSYRPALANLNAGMAVVPEDNDSRKLLTVLQYRFGRPDIAAQTAKAGVPYLEKTPASFDGTFALLRELQMEGTTIEIIQAELPPKPDQVGFHLYLALQLAVAQLDLGRYDACRETIGAWGLARAPQGRVLLDRCRFEEGDHKGAIADLEAATRQFKERNEIFVTLVRFARDDGDFEQMRRFAVLHYLDDPKHYEPRLDLIYAYAETKDEKGVSEEEAKYLAEFAGNRRALESLVQVAAGVGREKIAQDAYDVAKAGHYGLQAFRMGLIQAGIGSKDYKGALKALHEGTADLGDLNPTQSELISGLKAIALAGTGDASGADSALKEITKDTRYMRSPEALFLAKQMQAAGGTTEAYVLLQIAHDRDPSNAAATIAIVQADVDTKNHDELAKNLPALLALKRPEAALARSALPILNQPGDAPLRTAVRHLGETQDAASSDAK